MNYIAGEGKEHPWAQSLGLNKPPYTQTQILEKHLGAEDPFQASAPLVDPQKLIQVGTRLLQSTPTGLALTTVIKWFQPNSKKENQDSTKIEPELQKQLGEVAKLVQGKKFAEADKAMGEIHSKFFLNEKSEQHLSLKSSKNYSKWSVQDSLLRAEIFLGLGKTEKALEIYQKAYKYLAAQFEFNPKNVDLFRLKITTQMALAEHETDPTKKLFHHATLAIVEGRHAEAQLKLFEFKDKTTDSKDPAILKMRFEVTSTLHSYALGAIAKLSMQNASYTHGEQAATAKLLASLQEIITSGKADTLENALRLVPAGATYLNSADFWQAPVAAQGNTLVLDHPEAPEVKVEGGSLEVPSQGYPKECKLKFGTQGGYLKSADGKSYHVMPSPQGHSIVLKHGAIDVSAWIEGKDYLQDQSFGGHAKTPNAGKDEIFAQLLALETKTGLEKLQGQDGRQYLLDTAKRLRVQNAPHLAGEILEGLFQAELQRALAEIKPDQIHQIKIIAQARKEALGKGISAQLEMQKKEHPEEFNQVYPQGWPTPERWNVMVAEAMNRGIEHEIRKLAFQKIDGWNKSGWIFQQDPFAKQAWEIYENILNPCDWSTTISDEEWKQLPAAVVKEAAIAMVTVGVGSVVSATLRSSRLVRGALAATEQGGVLEIGLEAGLWGARVTAEGAVMLRMSGEELTLKNLGHNILTMAIFHGGGKLWHSVSELLAVDAASVQTAKAFGLPTFGKHVVNQAGAIATPTAISIGTDIVQGGEVTAKSAMIHVLKMAGFHFAGIGFQVLTDYHFVKVEQTAQQQVAIARLAKPLYQNLTHQGVPHELAEKWSLATVAGLQPTAEEMKADEQAYRIKNSPLKLLQNFAYRLGLGILTTGGIGGGSGGGGKSKKSKIEILSEADYKTRTESLESYEGIPVTIAKNSDLKSLKTVEEIRSVGRIELHDEGKPFIGIKTSRMIPATRPIWYRIHDQGFEAFGRPSPSNIDLFTDDGEMVALIHQAYLSELVNRRSSTEAYEWLMTASSWAGSEIFERPEFAAKIDKTNPNKGDPEGGPGEALFSLAGPLALIGLWDFFHIDSSKAGPLEEVIHRTKDMFFGPDWPMGAFSLGVATLFTGFYCLSEYLLKKTIGDIRPYVKGETISSNHAGPWIVENVEGKTYTLRHEQNGSVRVFLLLGRKFQLGDRVVLPPPVGGGSGGALHSVGLGSLALAGEMSGSFSAGEALLYGGAVALGIGGLIWGAKKVFDRFKSDLLKMALRHPDAKARAIAVQTMGRLYNKDSVLPVLQIVALKDPAAMVRSCAIEVIKDSRSTKVRLVLENLLSSSKLDVKLRAIWALADIGDKASRPALEAMLGDKEIEVQQEAVFALGLLKDPAAIPALQAARGKADLFIQALINEAIDELEQVDDHLHAPVSDPEPAYLNSSDPLQRARAIRKMKTPLAPSVKTILEEVLKWEDDPRVKAEILKALQRKGEGGDGTGGMMNSLVAPLFGLEKILEKAEHLNTVEVLLLGSAAALTGSLIWGLAKHFYIERKTAQVLPVLKQNFANSNIDWEFYKKVKERIAEGAEHPQIMSKILGVPYDKGLGSLDVSLMDFRGEETIAVDYIPKEGAKISHKRGSRFLLRLHVTLDSENNRILIPSLEDLLKEAYRQTFSLEFSPKATAVIKAIDDLRESPDNDPTNELNSTSDAVKKKS